MPGGERDDEVAVAAALELTLGSTEEAIEQYLQDPSLRSRAALAALESLDQQIDSSDFYESSTIGSAALGYSTKGSVIGETSRRVRSQEIQVRVSCADDLGQGGQGRGARTDRPDLGRASRRAAGTRRSTRPPRHLTSAAASPAASTTRARTSSSWARPGNITS